MSHTRRNRYQLQQYMKSILDIVTERVWSATGSNTKNLLYSCCPKSQYILIHFQATITRKITNIIHVLRTLNINYTMHIHLNPNKYPHCTSTHLYLSHACNSFQIKSFRIKPTSALTYAFRIVFRDNSQHDLFRYSIGSTTSGKSCRKISPASMWKLERTDHDWQP